MKHIKSIIEMLDPQFYAIDCIKYWTFISEDDYEEFMSLKNEEFTSEEIDIISKEFGSSFTILVEHTDSALYKEGSLNIHVNSEYRGPIDYDDPYFMWITKYSDEWYVIWMAGEYCGLMSNEECEYVKCDQFDGLLNLLRKIIINAT